MEQQKNSFEEPGKKLADFRVEMQSVYESENEKGKGHFINYPDFNVGDLTSRDLEVWEKIRNGTITQKEMREYSRELADEEGNVMENVPKSRIGFMAFANNKAGVVIAKREIEKMKRWNR